MLSAVALLCGPAVLRLGEDHGIHRDDASGLQLGERRWCPRCADPERRPALALSATVDTAVRTALTAKADAGLLPES